MRQKITCPETGHLEEITFDEDPIESTILGVRACSRFGNGEVDCDATCVNRLNARFASVTCGLRTTRPELGES